MGSTSRHILIVVATIALTLTTGCKSDGGFEEREKTAGEELEVREEHGDTAIDDADDADESDAESWGGDTDAR